MVVDKIFEFIEDIERFCVNHRWSRFFNDWETGDEALDEYAMIYKNCCNDVDEEKDAANDIFTELTEYMDCLYNYIDVDCVKVLDDEKQNARKWLDKVEKVIGSCVFSLKGNDLKGFLIKGYQMCHLIKEAAVKTPDEYYGGRRTDVMPYYIGEGKDQLFNNILNEADDTYKAKVGGKWLKGNKLVKDKKDADTFESKTEPTQRINQMKKDGKLNKNAKPSVVKESLQFFESKVDLFNSLLEAIDDFPKNTRAMYRFAKRKHDDTKAIRKVSKQPYWVHPEGVAKIVMEHGGSDIEIKAAMAHDVLEDTGESYEDMVEKFGEKVASIVKELTNDKYEIAKVGKEKYISEELCCLSPEALTVKLADILYNMKDSPTESNYERMRKNIAFLMMNRQLDGIHLALAEEILEV